MLRRFAPQLDARHRRAGTALLDLVDAAGDVGPVSPGPAVQQLLELAAEAHGIPGELLAAIAATLTQYDPAYRAPGRAGLLALPGGVPLDPADLARRDGTALDALQAHADAAAALLAELRDADGLARAIAAYAPSPAAAAAIVGAFVLQLARQLDTDRGGNHLQLLRQLCAS